MTVLNICSLFRVGGGNASRVRVYYTKSKAAPESCHAALGTGSACWSPSHSCHYTLDDFTVCIPIISGTCSVDHGFKSNLRLLISHFMQLSALAVLCGLRHIAATATGISRDHGGVAATGYTRPRSLPWSDPGY